MLPRRDFSSTAPELRVRGLVADEAGAGVPPEGEPALVEEARRVRVDALAPGDPLGRVARHAVQDTQDDK